MKRLEGREMSYTIFGILSWIAAPTISIIAIVGLCLPWLKSDGSMPGEKFKINHYGKTGLRHTCKMGEDAFNEGCLVYQSSVITIILCATSFATALVSALHSLLTVWGGEDFEENSYENAYSGHAISSTRFILAISNYYSAIFVQLLAAVVAYAIGSYGVRKDFGYGLSAGWILLVLSTAISFCVSLAPLVGLALYSKFSTLKLLPLRLFRSFAPVGSLLILVGLCTTFYANTDTRISALKLNAVPFTSGSHGSSPAIAAAVDLRDYCGGDLKNGHLCSLYRSSAANIAFVVFGLLSSVLTLGIFPKNVKASAYMGSFAFFFIGFVQYAAVGKKVKDDLGMHYGLGWVFSLVGLCFNGVGAVVCAAYQVIPFIRVKLGTGARKDKHWDFHKKLIDQETEDEKREGDN